MEILICASLTFAAGLYLGSRWQYRRILRQVYESAMQDGPRVVH
jgi:hypothetical protein